MSAITWGNSGAMDSLATTTNGNTAIKSTGIAEEVHLQTIKHEVICRCYERLTSTRVGLGKLFISYILGKHIRVRYLLLRYMVRLALQLIPPSNSG